MDYKDYVGGLIGWLVMDWSVAYIKKNILYAENFYYWYEDLQKVKEVFDFMVAEFGEAVKVTPTKCKFWDTENSMDFWKAVLKRGNTYSQYESIDKLKNALWK